MKILHLEDNPRDAELARDVLSGDWPGCEIELVDSKVSFEAQLKKTRFDLILSDFALVSFTGLDGLTLVQQLAADTPFIFFSGTIREEVAIAAVRDGAADYVFKERPLRLTTAIRHALSRADENRKRKEAEQAVAQSEDRFRQLVEQASDSMLVYGVDGKFFDVNQHAYGSLGYTREELMQCRIKDIDLDWSSQEAVLAHGEVMERGTSVTVLGRRLRKDGTIFPVEVRLGRFELNGQRLYLSLTRDITERVEAERRIREQNELLDQAREAIVVTDSEDRVVSWNKGAERLLGWSSEETVGKSLEGFMGLAGLRTQSESGKNVAWTGFPKVNAKNGRVHSLETHCTIILDNDGQTKGRVCISSDITEKMQVREQTLRAQRLESLGMLAAGIAHDLNNILGPLRMAPSLLREVLTTERDSKILGIIEASTEKGTQLVKQICRFAQGTSGEYCPFPLKPILEDLEKFADQTFPKNITLRLTISNDVWKVLGGPAQIHQVFLNLLINARDAMPNGGKLSLDVRNSADLDESKALEVPPGRFVVVAVQDWGTGIPPEIIPRIWDPFFTTKSEGNGTGLGLSTVRGIVETHGGVITMETAIGQGTKFCVYLPAAAI